MLMKQEIQDYDELKNRCKYNLPKVLNFNSIFLRALSIF